MKLKDVILISLFFVNLDFASTIYALVYFHAVELHRYCFLATAVTPAATHFLAAVYNVLQLLKYFFS